MEEKDDELIERYYRGDLDEAELAEFRRRLATDEAFWEAAHLHADALEAIRLEGASLLRKRLTEKGRQLDAQAQQRSAPTWWWLLPVLLLGAWVIWLLARPDPAPPAAPPPATPNAAPADTPPRPAPTAPDDRAPAAPARKTDRQIYATWFKPYRDESLEPSVRGADTAPSPSERFQQLYWDRDYQAALAAFDSLGETARNNDNLLFLKANCLLHAGRPGEAAPILESIMQRGRSRFAAQAPWYLALSHLRAGRRQEAETLLRRIAADTASPRQADARAALRALE